MKKLICLFSLVLLSACSTSPAQNSEFFSGLNISPNQAISSPLEITGSAKGTWFFEGSFPVRLLDENNVVITTSPAQSQSDWMTEDFVPFTATLNFTTTSATGTLVFAKDNPSGLPENDAAYEVPVTFAQ